MATPAAVRWFPRRGDVCRVHLDKDRPALVISSDAINRYSLDVCVIPITSVERRRFSLRVPLQVGEGGLRRVSWAKCDQVTTVEKGLVRYPPLGRIYHPTLTRIESAVKTALDLN
jgi:mRNA-degrading endonuclease toxin of MazEF toxin-antitoxin module